MPTFAPKFTERQRRMTKGTHTFKSDEEEIYEIARHELITECTDWAKRQSDPHVLEMVHDMMCQVNMQHLHPDLYARIMGYPLYDNDADLADRLLKVFNGNFDNALKYAHEIHEQTALRVVEITARYVKEGKIARDQMHRPLWLALSLSHRYLKSESNWNQQLNIMMVN